MGQLMAAALVVPVLRHGASPEAVRRSAVEQTNLFRRDGEHWTPPRLGQHLAASVHTGVFCSYEPERDIVWAVAANTG
jgi:hypothetical protein